MTILFGIPALVVASGILDSLATDGRINRSSAIGCLATYWVLACLAVLVVANLRRRWRELLSVFLTVLITLAISEVILRNLLPPRYLKPKVSNLGVVSRKYHHLHPPNADTFLGVFEGTPVFVRTNEDGLRTHYSRREFAEHASRIIILGDSFTFGLGVRQEYTFPEVMEDLLRDHLGRNDVAILNAGQVGYSPYVARLLYRGELIDYNATHVLLFLDTSDVGDEIRYQDLAHVDGENVYFELSGPRSVRYYGAIYELARPFANTLGRYLAYPLERLRSKAPPYSHYDYRIEIDGTVETDRFFIYRYPLEKTRPYFLNLLDNINRLATTVQEHGARFILVVFPRYHHWNPEESPENWEADYYPIGGAYQDDYFHFFEEIRNQLDYEVISLNPAFQQTDEYPLVFDADPHWNERGHAFVARVMAEHLLASQVLE